MQIEDESKLDEQKIDVLYALCSSILTVEQCNAQGLNLPCVICTTNCQMNHQANQVH